MPSRLLSLTFGIALTACGAPRQNMVLTPQVQTGPANGAPAGRVLVLHAACGSLDHPCPQSYIETVDNIVRGGLEFAGYSLVEAETLRNETRSRHEEVTTTTSTESSQTTTDYERGLAPDDRVTSTKNGVSETRTSYVVLDGSGWEDLSVDERHQVLAKSGASSVLSVRIVVGANVGMWTPDQNVEVMVKLGVQQGDAMAWAARCVASSNDFATVNAALEHAARCAIYGGTGHQQR